MARIPLWREDDPDTPDDAKTFLARCREATGESPFNALRALAHHSEASGHIMRFIGYLRNQGGLTKQQAELVWMSAALEQGCYY